MDQYQKFIAISKYARWLPEENRRETWEETVDRYINFFRERFRDSRDYKRIEIALIGLREQILNLKVMPSMRALMTAGPALDRDNIAGYNCSYLTISRQRAFDEMFYILMCGTGVGFSVERQYIQKLPIIAEEMYESETTIVVKDSKIGWASAYRELISLLYGGKIPKWDMSKVRPAGAPLKVFGGRASGPGPLEDLFQFTVQTFREAAGRKLTSIECHDICCKIGEAVVVGGVRRSACISLSNLTDDRMRRAKNGNWWDDNPQRALANNSVAYTEKPDMAAFMQEWQSLMESGSGERGIFNREASNNVAKLNGRRDTDHEFGTNPCSEIILRPNGLCNLTEAVVRSSDSFEDLKAKVEFAAILGTFQATLTDFRYVSKKWRDNAEEEALLGISLTGIMDNPKLNGEMLDTYEDFPETLEETLEELKTIAVATNKKWANILGINQAAAVSCVKPSGTVSQLVNSASGIHARYSPYYIRTVRVSKQDPIALLMKDAGIPCEDDATKPDATYVFSFPIKAPEGSVFRNDRNALEQLEHWFTFQKHWCEHKPSVTIYVKDEEWLEVGAWVYKNFDYISGISFLPHSNHTYRQAPYQEISEAEYNELVKDFPVIDWDKLQEYEKTDTTKGSQEFACVGNACELTDVS